MDLHVTLTAEDIATLLDALDSHEYWELGSDLPRNNGAVFIPGDYPSAADPFWPTEPTDDEAGLIDAVRASRRLAARLQRVLVDQPSVA